MEDVASDMVEGPSILFMGEYYCFLLYKGWNQTGPALTRTGTQAPTMVKSSSSLDIAGRSIHSTAKISSLSMHEREESTVCTMKRK